MPTCSSDSDTSPIEGAITGPNSDIADASGRDWVATAAATVLVAVTPVATMYIGSRPIAGLTGAGQVIRRHVTHTPASALPAGLGPACSVVAAAAILTIAARYPRFQQRGRTMTSLLAGFVVLEAGAVVLAYCHLLLIPSDTSGASIGGVALWMLGWAALGVLGIVLAVRAWRTRCST